MARAPLNVTRGRVNLVLKLHSRLGYAPLRGCRLLDLDIVAIDLYFTSLCSRAGGQPSKHAIGGFAIARIDHPNPPLVAHRFKRLIPIEDYDYLVRRVTIAIAQQSKQLGTRNGQA